VADINGDGKAEIVYDNSNNASGITAFTILDGTGAAIGEFKISSKSSFFTIVNWPSKQGSPHILLTEDGKISIINFKGETVARLDAPGCAEFGNVEAVNVRLRKEEPDYLAVKKSLHPDLSTLYVYDSQGQLMYQKTDTVTGILPPVLFTLPVGTSGTERLLVGSQTKDFEALLLEYTAPEAKK
jgi:hypothetical protein